MPKGHNTARDMIGLLQAYENPLPSRSARRVCKLLSVHVSLKICVFKFACMIRHQVSNSQRLSEIVVFWRKSRN